MSGAGAAGTAILKLLLEAGATDVVVGRLPRRRRTRGRADSGDAGETNLAWIAEHTNPRGVTRLAQGRRRRRRRLHRRLGRRTSSTGDDIATMADDAIVFAMANPDPEVDPAEAAQHAAVVATGRSDFANQINNVLVFPGVFRGLLDAATNTVSDDVLLAAANALAEVVSEDELNAAYIIPSVFHPDVAKVVAAAVEAAARSAAPGGGGDRRGRRRPVPHRRRAPAARPPPGLPSAVPPVAVPCHAPLGPHGG